MKPPITLDPSDVLTDIAFMGIPIKDGRVFLDIKNFIVHTHEKVILARGGKKMGYGELIILSEREYVRLVDSGFLDGGSDA